MDPYDDRLDDILGITQPTLPGIPAMIEKAPTRGGKGYDPAKRQNPSLAPQEPATDEERAILAVLYSVGGYPYDEVLDLVKVRELGEHYPQVDRLGALRAWATYKLDKPLRPKQNPRLQIRTWFEKSIEYNRNLKKIDLMNLDKPVIPQAKPGEKLKYLGIDCEFYDQDTKRYYMDLEHFNQLLEYQFSRNRIRREYFDKLRKESYEPNRRLYRA